MSGHLEDEKGATIPTAGDTLLCKCKGPGVRGRSLKLDLVSEKIRRWGWRCSQEPILTDLRKGNQ